MARCGRHLPWLLNLAARSPLNKRLEIAERRQYTGADPSWPLATLTDCLSVDMLEVGDTV